MGSFTFKNKVVIISGSTQGIGKAIATELIMRDAIVIINGRDKIKLHAAEQEIKKINNSVLAIQGDVSNEIDAEFIINETIKRYNRIDILINNAGLSMRGRFEELNPAVFRKVFDTNVFGAANLTIPALKYLKESKGSILFISSIAGIRGLPGLSAYCASKMALRGMAESIRIEEAGARIHIGLILVGQTEIDEGKKCMSANGQLINLQNRSKFKVTSKERVVRGILKNIKRRKFITKITWIGKLNSLVQAIAPWVLERILTKYSASIIERSK